LFNFVKKYKGPSGKGKPPGITRLEKKFCMMQRKMCSDAFWLIIKI